MSKKTKVIESSVQPNPKEAEIWAKINEDGSRELKQYNSATGKFEYSGGSGTGGGSGEAASTMEYLDVSGLSNAQKANLILYGIYLRGFIPSNNIFMAGVTYAPFYEIGGDTKDVTHIAIMLDEDIIMSIGETPQSMKIKQAVMQNNAFTQEELDSIPRITKEQFYSLT